IESLQRYLDRGGRLFLALDPDGGVDMHELLDQFEVKVELKTLANDSIQGFARRTHQDADHVNLVTASYSSHPSISTLSRMRAPVILPGAGNVHGTRSKASPGQAAASVDFPVRAQYSTFEDENGNFLFDAANEKRRALELAAAISKPVKSSAPP